MIYLLILALSGPSSFAGEAPANAVQELLKFSYDDKMNPEHLGELLRSVHPNDVKLEDIATRVRLLEGIAEKRHIFGNLSYPSSHLSQGGREFVRVEPEADSALFNGIYLASQVFEYLSTLDKSALQRIAQLTDGIYKLTHITGTPGALCRHAIPLSEAIRSNKVYEKTPKTDPFHRIYYSDVSEVLPQYSYLSNIVAGQNVSPVAVSPAGLILEPNRLFYENTYFYTRPSRDQMTGIAFGLSVATYYLEDQLLQSLERHIPEDHVALLEAIRKTTEATSRDIYHYLRDNHWKMSDPVSTKSGTANDVSLLLRLNVEMLYRRALMNSHPAVSLGHRTPADWNDDLEFFLEDNPDGIPPNLASDPLFGLDFWDRLTWKVTYDYYVWDHRTQRLAAIIMLDDQHPRFSAVAPSRWPKDSLNRVAVNTRNRRWISIWGKQMWNEVAGQSNPWFTYMFNFMRKSVLERHIGKAALQSLLNQRSVYGLTADDLIKGRVYNADKLVKALFDSVESSPSVSDTVTLGVGLPSAHFFLKSHALAPIRFFTPPCEDQSAHREQLCHLRILDKPYPPHLMRFRNWYYSADSRSTPSKIGTASPEIGTYESPLMEMPLLYWLAFHSGQLKWDFDAFTSEWFTPPELGSEAANQFQNSD